MSINNPQNTLSASLNLQNPRLMDNPSPIFPDRDTYVETSSANSNYGGQSSLYFGYSGSSIAYTYIHYNFTQKPTTFQSVYLSIDPWSIYETTNISICLLDSSEPWDEYSITYLNRPTTVIDQINCRIAEQDQNWFDITPLFNRNTLFDLSILLNGSYFQNHQVACNSKDDPYASISSPPISLNFVQTGDILEFDEDPYIPANNEIIPTKDTCVFSGNADGNFGGLDNLYWGIDYGGDIYATILHFENIPLNTNILQLSLDINSVGETLTTYVTIFTEDNNLIPWDELGMTWVSWPYPSIISLSNESNTNITKMIVSSTEISIDLFQWIGYSTLDIVLTTPLVSQDDVYCKSREASSSWLYEPSKLIVDANLGGITDQPSDQPSDIPKDNTLLFVGIILLFGVIVVIANSGNVKLKSRNTFNNNRFTQNPRTNRIPKASYVPVQNNLDPNSIAHLPRNLPLCPFCKSPRISLNSSFCAQCGKRFF